MAKVVIDIATQYSGTAFKKATGDAAKLEKSVGKLGKQLASVFAASKLYSFGKSSAKAFAADEKAARSLSLALANTGNAFAAVGVEKFIADLQRTTGVLDDNLRPAFRTLLTATGDVKKSQDGLALALDIAAGTGKDLGAVSMALAKAYGGQTTALSRLGAGLSKATLKTGDMDVIIAQLTSKFKGQALAAAQGYSGQMDRLAVASQNAKEIIGKDLLDAMSLVAGKDGIGGAASAMEEFATQIGNAIYGIGVLAAKIKSLPGAGLIGEVLAAGTKYSGLGLLSRYGASQQPKAGQASPGSGGSAMAVIKYQKEQAKALKELNALQGIGNKDLKEKLLLTAGEKALAELKRMFDIKGIEIQAALNGTISEEDRLRLNALKAINDNSEAEALLALKALDASSKIGDFAKAAADAAARLLQTSYSAGLSSFKQSEINSLTTGPIVGGGATPSLANSGLPAGGLANSLGFGDSHLGALARQQSTTSVVVNVAGSVTTQQDLVSAFTNAMYNNQASGTPPSFTTAFR